MKRYVLLVLLAAPVALSAQVLNKPKVAVRNWATGLNEPVKVTNCGDSRMFVVEKDGIIRIISDSMVVDDRPFLDISGPVQSGGNEQGLLSLAFEPNYLQNGYFYVYYIVGSGSGTAGSRGSACPAILIRPTWPANRCCGNGRSLTPITTVGTCTSMPRDTCT